MRSLRVSFALLLIAALSAHAWQPGQGSRALLSVSEGEVTVLADTDLSVLNAAAMEAIVSARVAAATENIDIAKSQLAQVHYCYPQS